MKILLATMLFGLAVFPNSVELSSMQSYATTSRGYGAVPLQAQEGAKERVLLHYYKFSDERMHEIKDPKTANLKEVNGYYVGKWIDKDAGRAHPIYGVAPHYHSCIQRIQPYTEAGQINMLPPKLQREYEVFLRELKLSKN